jgi:Cys-tRNA(Pro)/Cys-tRNA(Cys) deacylase
MTPATKARDKAGFEYRLHRYDHDPAAQSYGTEAADKLGLDPARVFKTLLASTEAGELLVAVVPVTGSLDLKALATAAGVKKTAMADPAVAQRTTGYLLGGISPLGQKKRLRTFIDNSAEQWPTVYVSGGRRGLEIEITTQHLTLQTRAQMSPLARMATRADSIPPQP